MMFNYTFHVANHDESDQARRSQLLLSTAINSFTKETAFSIVHIEQEQSFLLFFIVHPLRREEIQF